MSILNISDYLTMGIIAKGRNPVFKVKHLYSGKEYALKKVKRTDYHKHLRDFQEILYVSSCLHPSILKIIGFSLSQSRPQSNNEYEVNILMDLMHKNLEKEINDRQKTNAYFTKSELVQMTLSLVSALEFMQKKRKLAHRDIKPENILLNQDGDIFLADFGDSFQKTDMKHSAKTLAGSPYYMAPELKEVYLAGNMSDDFKYDPWKSDVYALGMTLIDVVCLKLGQRSSKNEIMKHTSDIYGEDYMSFLELLLEENPGRRCDFVQLVEHRIYLNIQGRKKGEKVKVFEEERKKNEDTVQLKVKTSEKLYNFIEKLPKNNKVEKLYRILTEIKKIEEMNRVERESQEQMKDKANDNEKVPEDYFKYFDCQ